MLGSRGYSLAEIPFASFSLVVPLLVASKRASAWMERRRVGWLGRAVMKAEGERVRGGVVEPSSEIAGGVDEGEIVEEGERFRERGERSGGERSGGESSARDMGGLDEGERSSFVGLKGFIARVSLRDCLKESLRCSHKNLFLALLVLTLCIFSGIANFVPSLQGKHIGLFPISKYCPLVSPVPHRIHWKHIM